MIKADKGNFHLTRGLLAYTTPDRSFSPHFSNTGVVADPAKNGLGALWLHYNRFSRPVFTEIAEGPFRWSREGSDLGALVYGNAVLRYYQADAFTVIAETPTPIPLFAPDPEYTRVWIHNAQPRYAELRGFTRTREARDPDEETAIALGVSAMSGTLRACDGRLWIEPEAGSVAFSAALSFPAGGDSACSMTQDAWSRAHNFHYWNTLCEKTLRPEDPPKVLAAKAGLLLNLTKAPGKLGRQFSAFPSRGEYPTHFLWDTCFQNLAYELFDDHLAESLLRQNLENQRPDGKQAQFICSTWERPQHSQPPLLGWAALRLLPRLDDRQRYDYLEALAKNTNWWLSARATETGLIYTPHGLETGQDDSPRFDGGPTIAADMNAYLLRQMRAAAVFARSLDLISRAHDLEQQAEAFAERLRRTLYDEADAIFYDLSLETRRPVRVISPAGLLPVWAGALEPHQARLCIRRHLLDPAEFYGAVPFPSVSYNDPAYEPDQWWRGPTWAPEAWLMLELLREYGFTREADEAAARLLAVLERDDGLHELFDSQTGRGLGAEQQGWTCAVYLRLLADSRANVDG